MREKGKKKKEKKILIRVNSYEKHDAETYARAEGKNTSEFFRSLLQEHKEKKLLSVHNEIVQRYEKTLEQYQELLKEYES